MIIIVVIVGRLILWDRIAVRTSRLKYVARLLRALTIPHFSGRVSASLPLLALPRAPVRLLITTAPRSKLK